MAASITLEIKLGHMVSFEIRGASCKELTTALEGYDQLNLLLDGMFSDLAGRIYPEGVEPADEEGEEALT